MFKMIFESPHKIVLNIGSFALLKPLPKGYFKFLHNDCACAKKYTFRRS